MFKMFLDGDVAFVEEQEVRNIGDSIGHVELHAALPSHLPLHRRDQLALHLLVRVDSSFLQMFPDGPFGHFQQSSNRSDGVWCLALARSRTIRAALLG